LKQQHNISPPKWAIRFLRFYCKAEFLDEIEGDLFEIFDRVAHKRGSNRAKIGFIWNTIRFFKWSNIKKTTRFNSNNFTMTGHNLKIAGRILWRHKMNTLLNVIGIAVGIACFVQISLFVNQELSFDKFHENGSQIFRVWGREDYGEGQEFFYTNTPIPLEKALEENIPEITTAIQYDTPNFLVGDGENRINERIAVASPEFFDVFSFPLLAGNTQQPLVDRNAIVLSEAYATKYFGNKEAVGESITVQIDGEKRAFVVSAIMQDLPKNTGFQFNMMISNKNGEEVYSKQAMEAWFNIQPETYILLNENASITDAESKLPAMIKTALGDRVEEGQYQLGFQSLADIHLNSDYPVGIQPVGNSKYVYVLGTIGILVLLIACINYTTLSIGQSLKRAKEVGVRKVVGAQKWGLISQYMSESILISFIALLIGLIFAYLTLPIFNELAETDLAMPLNLWSISLYVLLALLIGIATGIYPALVLSNLKLINVIRGAQQSSGGRYWLRKSLLIFQLLLTVFLISSTLIMKKQLNYMQNSDLGYQREAMVSMRLPADPAANGLAAGINSGFENGLLIKSQLAQNPQISNIGMVNHVFGSTGWTTVGFSAADNTFKQFTLLIVDPYYLSSFGIKIGKGRDFDPALEQDKREGVIINKAAAEFFGLDKPIGGKLPGERFGQHSVIGVTEDFNFASLHSEIGPLVIVQNPGMIFQGVSDFSISDSPIPKLTFKYNGGSLLEVKSILEKVWSSTFPNEELRFNFIDERLRLQYQEEGRVNKIIGIATALSITIASLGLLGLTILLVNTKVKEIGIRKILGASPSTIFGMLFKDLSVQLLIAIALSVPITLYLMRLWLADFAYRVNIGVDMFLFSGVLAFGLTLLVISYHAIRAAKSNPVKALRSE
jgi:putative ABC transport system permease protein